MGQMGSNNNSSGMGIDVGLLSDVAYFSTGVYLTIVGIVAFIGNICVILVLTFGRPNFIKIHSVLLFSISISDILVVCTAYPLTAVSGFHKRWVFSDTMCTLSGFLVYFLIMCNINSMCLMAISRYIIVYRPDLEIYIRGKYVKWLVLLNYSYALFWTGAPLVGWSSYVQESFKTSCTVNWDGHSIYDQTYNILCVVFCYCIPVAIYLYCYIRVARSSLFKVTPANIQCISGRESDQMQNQIIRSSKIRASRHMTMICIAMVTSFVVIWTPYAVLTLYNLFSAPISPSVQVLPTMFAKLSCVSNPIIYSAMCERFREAAMKIITSIRAKHRIFDRNDIHPTMHEDVTIMMLNNIASTSHQLPNTLSVNKVSKKITETKDGVHTPTSYQLPNTPSVNKVSKKITETKDSVHTSTSNQ